MAIERKHAPLLREDGGGDRRVTPIELFFDLVFVFAVTQLSRLLLDHLTPHGVLQTGLLLLAIGWAWVCTAWATNWLDPNQGLVRGMIGGVMGASLIMSAALPEAFGDRGLFFAVAYAGMQMGQTVFILAYVRDHRALYRNFQRILVWFSLAAVFWVAGGIADGASRELLWLAAVAIGYLGPIAAYYTPGLGRATSYDFHFSGEHMADRCQLFLIIALGESILVTGVTYGELAPSWTTLAAFVVAFLGSVALWWVYFGRSAEAAAETVARWGDAGMLVVSAYTYLHLPMVAGIIVTAVGDELSIAHPLDSATPAAVATILGGPAIFLAGHLLFTRSVFGVWSAPRLAAIAGLAAIAVTGRTWSHLMLATSAMVIVAAVSWSDAGIPRVRRGARRYRYGHFPQAWHSSSHSDRRRPGNAAAPRGREESGSLPAGRGHPAPERSGPSSRY
jgi:low temperature requirement protein LtrA